MPATTGTTCCRHVGTSKITELPNARWQVDMTMERKQEMTEGAQWHPKGSMEPERERRHGHTGTKHWTGERSAQHAGNGRHCNRHASAMADRGWVNAVARYIEVPLCKPNVTNVTLR